MSVEISPQMEGLFEGAVDPADARALSRLVVVGVDGATQRTIHELHEYDRNKEVFRLTRDPETYEVTIESHITLEDYKSETRPEDWDLLLDWANQFKGQKVVFVNPTMEGGGVAMLRPPAVHLLKLLGVEAHWYVMEDMKEPDSGKPFVFTKLMHNISQRRAGDARINDEGKAIHQQWNRQNFEVLKEQDTIKTSDIFVIDDPQPAPLIPLFKTINTTAKFVWRNHIDTDGTLMADPTTPQGEVASYLLNECGVAGVDAAITHPVEAFTHHELADRTFFAPATTEPHDDLNRPLNEVEKRNGFDFINNEIYKKNQELIAQGRFEDVQAEMDPSKNRITLIARFDESKGMDHAMELGVLTRARMRKQGVAEEDLPEVVIVGNGSIDDPSGIPMYEEILRLRRQQKPEDIKSIIVMRLKHNYTAMNALMSRSTVITQTSEAEGWETRVSDAIEHGVPVVVSNRGGISKQVVEGESGFVLDFDKQDYDLNRGASIIEKLLTDGSYYEQICETTRKQAHAFNRREITTTANVSRFLRIFNHILRDIPADHVWKISEMVEIEAAKRAESAKRLGLVAVK
jgi:alpha,alpha-trehalose phosphorylase (configuration-retaining)